MLVELYLRRHGHAGAPGRMTLSKALHSTTPRRHLFFQGLGLLLLAAITVAAGPARSDATPAQMLGGIAINPQAAYTFLGWDQLGRALGISEESGVRLGGMFLSDVNWLVSGGQRPNTVSGNEVLLLHTSLDAQKAFGVPGGTFGIEFAQIAVGLTNNDAGSVQQYNNVADGGMAPRNREELSQLWWHQRLFDNKLIFQLGKVNPTGQFGVVLKPVVVSEPNLREQEISNLIFTPVGLNPTLYGRLPAYPNTAYGVTVHVAPTENLYMSYGLFDGNNANFRGEQTGLAFGPQINSYKFHIGELGVSWRLGEGHKPGRFGVGGWGQTGQLLTPSLTFENGATGYYLFANQRLWYRHPNLDNSGLVGYLQFGHTGDQAVMVNNYVGAGLTGIGLVPGRPFDTISVGLARSGLNQSPGAGEFFFPGVSSNSANLRASEFMLQAAYETTFIFGNPWSGSPYWTLTGVAAYTYIPNPGQRPDLPAANALTVRLIALF